MSKHLKNTIAAAAPNAAEQAINTLISQAEQLISDKKADEAIALLEEAEVTYPDNVSISFNLGKTLAKEKSILDGLKKLEATLERFPEHLGLLLEIGQIHLKPGNTKLASPYFHRALQAAPQNPNPYLAIGSLHQRQGELSLAVENYRKAIELQLKHPITEEEPKKKNDFETGKAENLLWNTLKLMAENGVHMFPIFGTLLGIVRHGALLLHDKDIDTGIPYSEMKRALGILQQHGWQEINNSFGYSNPRAMLHKDSGITMDISGFVIDEQDGKALTAGAWIPGVPKEWNMIWEFNEITLEKSPTPDESGQAWLLKNPEQFLEVLYGDWRTPDKNFDTMVRAKNLRSFSLLAKCFAYSRIFENWTKNNIPRALALTRATLERDQHDALLKRVLSRLEARRKEIMNG